MQPKTNSGNWWDNLSEILLAGVDGYFDIEEAKLQNTAIENQPPVPDPDRVPDYVRGSLIPGIPDYAWGILAGVAVLGVLLTRK